MADIILEVLEKLGVMREIGPVARYGIILECQTPLRGIYVCRL